MIWDLKNACKSIQYCLLLTFSIKFSNILVISTGNSKFNQRKKLRTCNFAAHLIIPQLKFEDKVLCNTLTLNGPGFLVDPEAGGGLNQDALVFDVLYCYLSLKTCIQGLKLKFGSSVVCRINDQHPSLSSFSVRPCQIYVLR